MRLLRSLFFSRRKRREIWRTFAEENGGRYFEGGWLKSDRVEFMDAGSEIRLTAEYDAESGTRGTCFWSALELNHDVSVILMKNWPMQRLLDSLGMFEAVASKKGWKKIPLSELGIDADGFVLTTTASSAQRIFDSAELQAAIGVQDRLLLTAGGGGSFPRSCGISGSGPQMALLVPGIAESVTQLADLLQLYRLLIDTLQAAGMVRR
jgi:hypothetical protein